MSNAGRVFPKSLVWRLTLYYAVTSGLLLLAVSIALLNWALLSSVHRETDDVLRSEAAELRAILREYPEQTTVLRDEVEAAPQGPGRPMFMRVLDADRHAVVESPGMAALLPSADFPGAATGEVAHADRTAAQATGGRRPYRLLAMRVPVRGGDLVLQIGMDVSFERRLINRYEKPVAVIMGLATLASVAAGYLLARSGIRPMNKIAETMEQIQSTSLNRRVDAGGFPAELTQVADTFNAMMGRMEESFARLTRFSADIAHELRTPVSVLCGQLEVALGRARSVHDYRATLESCLDEGRRLTELIGRLLFLARAEAEQAQIGRERLAVRDELEAIREFYDAHATEAGIELTLDAPPGLYVRGDRALLQSAIGNLMENALSHTPRGGRIVLRARPADGHRVRVQVEDSGTGIAPEHLPYVFERFYRSDPSRLRQEGHAGLGLAIVRSIATLHGGDVSAESAVGRWTRVTLDVPAEDDGNVISPSSSRKDERLSSLPG